MKQKLALGLFAGLICVLLSQNTFAQDPELLMNEARYAARYHTFNNHKGEVISVGPSAGATMSILNLFFSNFNTKRYRIGDAVGGDIVPIGYTNSSVPTIPLLVWLRMELGVQGYYAVNNDLDLGVKVFNEVDANWDAGWAHTIIALVARYKSLILETSTGTEGKADIRHYQGSLKFILGNEDHYSGIFGRYEYQQATSSEPYVAKHWSVGYFVHFAAHR